MKHLRIPLRIVFYREDGEWVAHCLEFDLMGSGADKVAAFEQLNEAISLQVAVSLEGNNAANLFRPAMGKYFEMFSAGLDVVVGELSVETGQSIKIDRTEAREYSGEGSESDLVRV